jgi:putative flippase GtrA
VRRPSLRLSERWRRLTSFGVSSLIATACSELAVVLCYGPLSLGPTVSSVVGWLAGAVPNFFVNRTWTWRRRGRVSLRGELLPYLAIVLSTLLVAILATHGVDRLLAGASPSVRTTAVAVTFLGVYVLMFLVRYVLFSRLYRTSPPTTTSATTSADGGTTEGTEVSA